MPERRGLRLLRAPDRILLHCAARPPVFKPPGESDLATGPRSSRWRVILRIRIFALCEGESSGFRFGVLLRLACAKDELSACSVRSAKSSSSRVLLFPG